MIKLKDSRFAKFYEKYSTVVDGELKEYTHVYVTPEGGFLPGVTGMIKKQLFPKKYGDVPAAVLAAAAARGSFVHHNCECLDKGMTSACVEAMQYMQMRKELGMEPVANEYCVSLPTMASCIDCVWSKDGEVYLADIKTTYELDEEYLSWQLSIYAYMFEKQNPGLYVKGLYGVWLYKGQHDKTKVVTITRKSDAEVEALIDAEVSGRQYIAAPTSSHGQIVNPSLVEDFYNTYKMVEDMNERMELFKQNLKAKFEELGLKSYDFGKFKISYTPASESEVFDSAKFKKENPDIAKQYMKTQKRSASMRVTLGD